MRLHLMGVPHTYTDPSFSSCAFTGKVQRMPKMVKPFGWEVIHYGVEGAKVECETVDLMTQAEHQALLGHPYHAQNGNGTFYGDDAKADSPVYRQFNYEAKQALKERLEPGDLVLFPFGFSHMAAMRGQPLLKSGQVACLESGIGYFDCALPWRVYESEAVRHAVMAKEARYGVSESGPRLEWVAPNYYDIDEWPAGQGGDHIVFLGRMTEGKGLRIVKQVAEALPHQRFVLAGQGNADVLGAMPSNVEQLPPLVGKERIAYLGNAKAILAPSRYVEPFCGVVVEAALCGTPAITSHFGAFTETVEDGVTGFRCQTLADYIAAVERVGHLDREWTRMRAQMRYGLDPVGRLYDAIFKTCRQNIGTFRFPEGE